MYKEEREETDSDNDDDDATPSSAGITGRYVRFEIQSVRIVIGAAGFDRKYCIYMITL